MARPACKEPTPRQREILAWVKAFIREHGMPPTVREIGDLCVGYEVSRRFRKRL